MKTGQLYIDYWKHHVGTGLVVLAALLASTRLFDGLAYLGLFFLSLAALVAHTICASAILRRVYIICIKAEGEPEQFKLELAEDFPNAKELLGMPRQSLPAAIKMGRFFDWLTNYSMAFGVFVGLVWLAVNLLWPASGVAGTTPPPG